MITTDQEVLAVQVRMLEQALHSREFRHHELARAIFEARLLALRLASMAAETPSVQSQAIHTRLMRYAHAQAHPRPTEGARLSQRHQPNGRWGFSSVPDARGG
jgi:hypothetical protein